MMDDVKEADDKKRQYRNVDPLQDLNLYGGSGRVLYSRLCSGLGSGSILSTIQRIGIGFYTLDYTADCDRVLYSRLYGGSDRVLYSRLYGGSG